MRYREQFYQERYKALLDQLCGSHTRRTVHGQKDNMRLMLTNVQAASLNENERRQIGVRHKNHYSCSGKD